MFLKTLCLIKHIINKKTAPLYRLYVHFFLIFYYILILKTFFLNIYILILIL